MWLDTFQQEIIHLGKRREVPIKLLSGGMLLKAQKLKWMHEHDEYLKLYEKSLIQPMKLDTSISTRPGIGIASVLPPR